MEDLSAAYDVARENPTTENYTVVKDEIHKMKGSSSYCGGARITEDCYWMQVHSEDGEYEKMMEYYPKLIEHVLEFRVYHRKLIAEHRKQEPVILPEHETCAISKYFTLKKTGEYSFEITEVPAAPIDVASVLREDDEEESAPKEEQKL